MNRTKWLTDRPQLDQTKHNYVKAFTWLQAQGKVSIPRGTVTNFEVIHDDPCGIFQNQLCNYRPILKLNGKLLKYPTKILGDTYHGNRRQET